DSCSRRAGASSSGVPWRFDSLLFASVFAACLPRASRSPRAAKYPGARAKCVGLLNDRSDVVIADIVGIADVVGISDVVRVADDLADVVVDALHVGAIAHPKAPDALLRSKELRTGREHGRRERALEHTREADTERRDRSRSSESRSADHGRSETELIGRVTSRGTRGAADDHTDHRLHDRRKARVAATTMRPATALRLKQAGVFPTAAAPMGGVLLAVTTSPFHGLYLRVSRATLLHPSARATSLRAATLQRGRSSAAPSFHRGLRLRRPSPSSSPSPLDGRRVRDAELQSTLPRSLSHGSLSPPRGSALRR